MIKVLKEAEEIMWISRQQADMEDYHFDRTLMHRDSVQQAANKIAEAYPDEFGELPEIASKHDNSKLEEPELTPYISITWRHKLEKENDEFDPINSKGYQTPGMLDKKEENEATLHHVTSNPHHPEYWDPDEANIDPDNRNKSVAVISVPDMPPMAIAEMVADWEVMSTELGKNTAREWFEKQKGVRWDFTKEQEELINKLLQIFEVKETREDKSDIPVVRGVISKSHDAPIGLFWWDFRENKLSYTPYTPGLYHGALSDFSQMKGNDSIIRGRLFKDGEKNVVLVYLTDYDRMPMTQDSLNSLASAVSSEANVTVSYVVDENGFDLVESKLDETKIECPHCGAREVEPTSWSNVKFVCGNCGRETELGKETKPGDPELKKKNDRNTDR